MMFISLQKHQNQDFIEQIVITYTKMIELQGAY